MSKIIIVTGHLAALKSTLSHQLSNDLCINVINKDTIKEILGDSIGFKNREENLKLSHATFEMMKYMLKKSMDSNQHLIIESNFKKHELIELENMVKLSKSECLTLFLTGDPKILYQRYILRQPQRHPVHVSTGLMPYEVFLNVINEYRIDDCFGKKIEINTTNFNPEMYQNICQEIKSYIESIN